MIRGAAILLLLSLTACGIQYRDLQVERRALTEGTPCCEQLSDLRYEPLPLGGPTEIQIDKTDQIFDFGPPFGRSFVRAFVLPTDYQDLWFRIRSYPSKPGLIETPGYLIPQITLLDKDYTVIGFSDPRQIVQIDSTFLDEPMEPPRIGLFARSRAEMLPRFMIVHTTEPMMYAGGTQRVLRGGTMVAIPGGGFVSVPGRSGNQAFTGYPTGRLKIWLGQGEPPQTSP